jgi:NAD(P)-dependent dehydrogenase (short-subunit alcohol dehydrogenase family)
MADHPSALFHKYGVWNAARATVPRLIEQGDGGSIVITSSLAGLERTPLLGAYTAAKHGVVGLMRTLAPHSGELAPPDGHRNPDGAEQDHVQTLSSRP